MRTLFLLLSAILGPALLAQTNPAPLVNDPLVPDAAAPGSGGFTLTVNGVGFDSGSIVNWNGAPRTTVFVSGSQLKATILAADVAAAGTASVTVVNPGPGGGTSNVDFFSVAPARSAVAFGAVSTPADVAALASGDFNGDGKLDLAGLGTDGIIDIFLGNGDGTFEVGTALPAPCPANPGARTLALGDFNGDGKLDIAVPYSNECGSGGVAVFLGNGDGTFQPYKNFNLGVAVPYASAVGDFNGDGKLDLAMISALPNAYGITILLGDGDGTFGVRNDYSLASPYSVIALGDFNRDGKIDVLADDNGMIEVWPGTGDGTLDRPVVIGGPYSEASVADFNGDGILDIAAFGSNVSILLGNGDGTFQPPSTIEIGPYAGGIIPGDFNGDGRIDLALTADLYQKQIGSIANYALILPGNGDGTFGTPQYAGWTPGGSVLAGDFNGDGLLDLAAPKYAYLQTTALPSPAGLFFPTTLIYKPAPAQIVTVTNVGASPLNITQFGFIGANAGDFSILSNTCVGTPVPAAGSCSANVAFTPTAAGERTANLTIADNAIANPQAVNLVGFATALEIVPARLDFGSVKVGTASPDLVMRVINRSTSAVRVRNIAFRGSERGDFLQFNTCGSSIAAKATCSIEVQFLPTKRGTRRAVISIDQTSVDHANPKEAPVAGTGS